MSLNYAIFKICPNSPGNDGNVKQVSLPSILGIIGDKKWCPFSDLGVQSPIFWHLKTANSCDLGRWIFRKFTVSFLSKSWRPIAGANSFTIDRVNEEGGFQLLSYSVNSENAWGQLSRLVLEGKTRPTTPNKFCSFFVTNRRFSSLTGASNWPFRCLDITIVLIIYFVRKGW